uniref:cleavage and polyadenylation specificity factor subunit 4 n=1 Tax=Ciona intestinalis TaxID=7719 RepID=UPI000180C700|nr:cleavage and polyadenylation specificity factor subunit 4 [Ciona intestinalis]|eukprot:XP_002129809.1 cleavage and polyadenylation specificity factor subunit 4 [Ciona intestinalis]
MQEVVANLDHVKFDLEYAIDQQLGVQPLPFTGMDKSGAPVCHFFKLSICQRGANCPFRHVLGDKAIVCKHWLRGLCKKGDQCEFLHEYDMSKMPECYFYARFGRCDNKDCQYQHIDPASKIKDCPWYDRGFCKHGATCKHRHRRKIMCMNYLVGFCPEGGKCKFVHPLWELPVSEQKGTRCHICNEYGHKANHCHRNLATKSENGGEMNGGLVLSFNKQSPSAMQPNVKKLVDEIFEQRSRSQQQQIKIMPRGAPRDLSRITCFRCGQKGHYASRCAELFPNLPRP